MKVPLQSAVSTSKVSTDVTHDHDNEMKCIRTTSVVVCVCGNPEETLRETAISLTSALAPRNLDQSTATGTGVVTVLGGNDLSRIPSLKRTTSELALRGPGEVLTNLRRPSFVTTHFPREAHNRVFTTLTTPQRRATYVHATATPHASAPANRSTTTLLAPHPAM